MSVAMLHGPFAKDAEAPPLIQGGRARGAGRGVATAALLGACAISRSKRSRCAGAGRGLMPPRAPGSVPASREGSAWSSWPGARFPARVSAHGSAPGPGRGGASALDPPAVVAESVSSLTIAEAFIAAGESSAPTPPRPALPRRFICSFPDCSANYSKAWKLDAHLCKHTGERPFVCDYEGCGKAFIRDYHLSRHILTHTGEKPFVCAANGCDQKFNTKSNLKKHFERKHENQQKQYICSFEDCRKAFKKHQQLKIHQCQHTSEPLFKCTQEGCGKHFASPSKLKRHAKTHEGYVCQKGCSLVAKTWTELLKHVRETHKEEILCEVCQKTFKRKDYLKQHMKTHAPERDVCRCPREGCGRTYTTVFNLQSHILSFHEERRPFVCEHAGCGKTFAMKQSLTRHAVVHDPDKKKMKLKVKKSREKRSLASRLSGYIPPKRKQGQGLPLCQNRESPNCVEDKVLSTVAVLTLS
ncbi:LOW QUALITY PROTEIN: transcription factor IIIA [Rhinopithecus roxellana]|uniref:LOW QUALITY PROTEIN: transcription factor IIIA n=1 Tax=Rhinopithecus roxellana TaxID=61622 RepID=UPI00123788C6|nr:LOW QUALITY PROTEIN: transcription factor IIIA [Rhinopithecus roxellana]